MTIFVCAWYAFDVLSLLRATNWCWNSSWLAILITQNHFGIGVADMLEERLTIMVRDEHEIFAVLIDREDGDCVAYHAVVLVHHIFF